MYVLGIGRAYPKKKTGMMGIFEFEQAKALRNNNNKTIYAFCDTRSIKSLRKFGYYHEESSGVKVYGYHLPIGGVPQVLFSKIKKMYYKKIINEVIKKEGVPDIIHVHFPLLTLTDEIWSFLKGFNRPIVVTEHWTKVQINDLEPFRRNLLNRIVKESEEFICVSELLKKSVIELTNTKKNIKVIPNMVSSLFHYEESNLDKNHFEFISVGRLVEVKNFELVISAFAKAFSETDNINLTIIGGGPLSERLKRQIIDLGMENRIVMLGFLSRDETAKKVKECDAFVSASILETFGVPFIEAMVCGKPVIGIEGGAIDKYINSTNGILFERNNLDNLAKALNNIYENKDCFKEKEISKIANGLFSEEAVANQLLNVFNDCLYKN